jgi:hypothetical protein
MSETWSRTHISHVWRVTADFPKAPRGMQIGGSGAWDRY